MRKNVKYLILGLSLLLIVSSIGIPIFVIGQIIPSQNSNQNLIYGTGVITYVPLEGGFFGIISDDGNEYDPINLQPEFEIDGLRIIFMGQLLNLYSIHMWGRIIRILFIQKF
ncbi:MAG: hypothetical protein ACFFB9_13400 [Promethearchaeota archaeon]